VPSRGRGDRRLPNLPDSGPRLRTSRSPRDRCRTSNTNKSKRFIEMGAGKNKARAVQPVRKAKSYMQNCCSSAAGCKAADHRRARPPACGDCITCSSTRSKGPRKKTFDGQEESDTIVEDVEVTLTCCLREELHPLRQERRLDWSALSYWSTSGDEIDCSRMGSGGYNIPSICEPDVVQFKKCDAKFILHVEKDTVWRRFQTKDKFLAAAQVHSYPRRRTAPARRPATAATACTTSSSWPVLTAC